MKMANYDVMILGSGPAGLAAAIYASRAALKTAVVEKEMISGGQIINTYEVDNYPGLPGIGGFDLAEKFREHSDKMGTEYITGEVVRIEDLGAGKKVHLADGQVFETASVVIATGARHRHLDVPGELQFTGAGVSYCATCDGAFFRGKDVVVVGGGDVAVEDAIFLARLCRKVYVVHRRDSFRAAKVLSQKLIELPNVEILWNHVTEEIEGDQQVTGIRLKNVVTEEVQTIPVDGVFIAVGIQPNSDAFAGAVEMDEGGYIRADETGVTSVPGIFAAGDVRTKMLRQVVTATADGANAITSVERYLTTL